MNKNGLKGTKQMKNDETMPDVDATLKEIDEWLASIPEPKYWEHAPKKTWRRKIQLLEEELALLRADRPDPGLAEVRAEIEKMRKPVDMKGMTMWQTTGNRAHNAAIDAVLAILDRKIGGA